MSAILIDRASLGLEPRDLQRCVSPTASKNRIKLPLRARLQAVPDSLQRRGQCGVAFAGLRERGVKRTPITGPQLSQGIDRGAGSARRFVAFQLRGAPWTTGREPRHFLGIGSGAAAENERRHCLTLAKRAKPHFMASAPDGWQQQLLAMGDKEKDSPRRWLLKRLQQCVRAEAVQLIQRIDDCNPPSAHRRPQRKEFRQCPYTVDWNLRLLLSGVIDRAADDSQIGMAAGHHKLSDARRLAGRQRAVALAQQVHRELKRQPRFSDAARASQQPSMMQTIGRRSIQEFLLGYPVTDNRSKL
ncbi:MAG: hypothetical protein R3C46_12130 [Hyphomonadaceae bacterium]